MLRHWPSSAVFGHTSAEILALFCFFEGCVCSGTRPLLRCRWVLVLSHSPSSALLRGTRAQTLTLFQCVCAQELALFHLVEGCLC